MARDLGERRTAGGGDVRGYGPTMAAVSREAEAASTEAGAVAGRGCRVAPCRGHRGGGAREQEREAEPRFREGQQWKRFPLARFSSPSVAKRTKMF